MPVPTETPRQRRPYASRMPVEQRRTELLDAALRVVARDGYGALTVEAIAREAGVTKPVLYGAFDSLAALLGTLLERQQAKALGQLLAAAPLVLMSDPRKLAGRITRTWVEMVDRDPATWQLVLLTGPGTPELVQQRIEQGREAIREQLAGLVRMQLPADGPVDATVVAHALVATAEHFGRLLLTDRDSVDVDRLSSTMQALVTGTLATARARPTDG